MRRCVLYKTTKFASDGRDNGDHAGAIADAETRKHMEEQGLDIDATLAENNSFPFFEKSGDAILTGRTGSNVSDLVIAMKRKTA